MHSINLENAYRGKRVLLTGHTGFKGAWLAEWLLALGAEVTGYSLPPPTEPSLFKQLGLEDRLDHRLGDIRDLEVVKSVFAKVQPDYVFHLAAQPLVRLSYTIPVETYATNVMGTAHVLEAVRLAGHPCSIVCITTDKCYHNREWVHGYREEDAMGGADPYSSSKGAAELVIAAYRNSYFGAPNSKIRVASARAGNVIGGGDWALDRIVPDCVRHLQKSEVIAVRNKVATRPWQHVLEPLSGYLWLGAALGSSDRSAFKFPVGHYTDAFNFGPNVTSNRTVAELVQEVLKHWEGQWKDMSDPKAPHEAKLLSLTVDKAFHLLDWTPVWNFAETVANTISWYRDTYCGTFSPGELTRRQIADYTKRAAEMGVRWAGRDKS